MSVYSLSPTMAICLPRYGVFASTRSSIPRSGLPMLSGNAVRRHQAGAYGSAVRDELAALKGQTKSGFVDIIGVPSADAVRPPAVCCKRAKCRTPRPRSPRVPLCRRTQ